MSNLDAISFAVTPAAYFFTLTLYTNLQYFLDVLHAYQLCSRLITLPCNDIRNASLGINIDNTFVVKKLNVSIERFAIPDIKTSHANFTYFKVVLCFRSLKYNPYVACVSIYALSDCQKNYEVTHVTLWDKCDLYFRKSCNVCA